MPNHGTPRDALVEPSSGSTTTTGRSDGPCIPLSSESTENPAEKSRSRHARSASRSTAYCPSRNPEAPHTVFARSTSATASATSRNVSRA